MEQDDFLNGCVELETVLEPEELLNALHEIEGHAGRTREIHWGPRTLDLDILFYDDRIMVTENLTIPHKEIPPSRFCINSTGGNCTGFCTSGFEKNNYTVKR